MKNLSPIPATARMHKPTDRSRTGEAAIRQMLQGGSDLGQMLVSARQESPCVLRFEHRNSSKPETAHSLRPRPSLARPVQSSVRPRKDRTVAPRAIPCSKAHKDDRATSSTQSAQANAASRDWWPTTRRKADQSRRLEIPRSSMWGLPRAAGANRHRDRWAWTGNSPERPEAQRKNPEARRER